MFYFYSFTTDTTSEISFLYHSSTKIYTLTSVPILQSPSKILTEIVYKTEKRGVPLHKFSSCQSKPHDNSVLCKLTCLIGQKDSLLTHYNHFLNLRFLNGFLKVSPNRVNLTGVRLWNGFAVTTVLVEVKKRSLRTGRAEFGISLAWTFQ